MASTTATPLFRAVRAPRSVLAGLLATVAWSAAPADLAAQAAPWKIQPYLRDRIAEAAPGEKLPVYFVMRERLGYHSWFPELRHASVTERRARVLADLRRHAARTQAATLALLGRARDAGEVDAICCNCVGNFVQCRATAATIEAAAALDDVWEIWHDTRAPLQAYEDGAPALPNAVGDGPAAVGADRVWAMGFRGQGVVVMNADSGINVAHQALVNQLWTNPGEIPGNRIDDDGNGFVDDVHGWGFDWNRSRIDDNGGHGTSTAGVMVADGSCNGTTYGIAPAGRVMTGKLSGEASQWNAIQYAMLMGAQMQTSSHSYKNFASAPPNYMVHRDIGEVTLAAGLIRTNSTSNSGGSCTDPNVSNRRPFNVSVPGNLPSPYLDPKQTLVGRLGGVIGVGAYTVSTGQLDPLSPCGPSAWDLTDLLAVMPSFPTSKWDSADDDYPWAGGTQLGLIKPDVLAPTGTTTTVGPGATCAVSPFGGTSNATPIAMGCMMLWKSANPSLTPEDVAMIVHQTADDYGLLPGKENTYGAGRIDAVAGVHRALSVHRVDGQPAWEVWHRSGTPLQFEIDGSANRPALIALGLSRQTVDFGAFESGIGSVVVEVASGRTGASGEALAVTVPTPAVSVPTVVYSQAFVDDRAGPTGTILASNVIAVRLQP